MLQILHKTNIDFMGWKSVSFTFSSILIILGLVGLLQIGRGKANVRIDLIGGTTVETGLMENIPIVQTLGALETSGFQGGERQGAGDGGN